MVSRETGTAGAAKTGSPQGGAQEPGLAGGYARTGLWLVLAAAFLGWMFDGMEQGLFATVARPALKDLLGAAASEAAVGQWISYIMAAFLLGAACGGLAFGWLGDRIGRVRAMALSILVYSGFIGACCFAAHPGNWPACNSSRPRAWAASGPSGWRSSSSAGPTASARCSPAPSAPRRISASC